MFLFFCLFVSILEIIILFLRCSSFCDMHKQMMSAVNAFTMLLLVVVFFFFQDPVKKNFAICDEQFEQLFGKLVVMVSLSVYLLGSIIFQELVIF